MVSNGYNPRQRNGHRRRQNRARVKAANTCCYICGRPIDYTLKSPDPWSYVLDETIPIARGGTLTYNNSGAAHRWCNQIKGVHSLEWARKEVANILNGKGRNMQARPTSIPFTRLDV